MRIRNFTKMGEGLHVADLSPGKICNVANLPPWGKVCNVANLPPWGKVCNVADLPGEGLQYVCKGEVCNTTPAL